MLFHVPKTKAVNDEWIDIDSSRIAPLNTKQDPNSKPKRPKKKTEKKAGQLTTEKTVTVAPSLPSVDQKLGRSAQQNGAASLVNKPSREQLLREMAAAAVASAREISVHATLPIVGIARPVYPTTTTVHSDGRVSMQLANHPQSSPIRSFAGSGTQLSSTAKLVGGNASNTKVLTPEKVSAQPVASTQSASYNIPRKTTPQGGYGSLVGRTPKQTASYTIPRKAAPQGGDGTSIGRIPRQAVPPAANADMNGASLLLGLTASGLSRNMLATTQHYFPPNQPNQAYPARMMHGQYPLSLPTQYFDARNFWQGEQQQGPPRRYGGSPDKKQCDGR